MKTEDLKAEVKFRPGAAFLLVSSWRTSLKILLKVCSCSNLPILCGDQPVNIFDRRLVSGNFIPRIERITSRGSRTFFPSCLRLEETSGSGKESGLVVVKELNFNYVVW